MHPIDKDKFEQTVEVAEERTTSKQTTDFNRIGSRMYTVY